MTLQGFALLAWATTAAEGDQAMMMMMLLLMPIGLLALLLGMERLERWTVQEKDDKT
jgi:Tfp pilus assembly protein PilN